MRWPPRLRAPLQQVDNRTMQKQEDDVTAAMGTQTHTKKTHTHTHTPSESHALLGLPHMTACERIPEELVRSLLQ